jgi:predicted MFS family arabinose efflux permease
MSGVRHYALVTGAYWAFTLTDGALRMLVLLRFHQLGYGPVELAFLFLFYELAGVVTNLVGGWIAAHRGLRATLLDGLLLQIVALTALAFVDASWPHALTVAYVMAAQALSGIAKDLTKMSSKSAIKVLLPPDAHSALFRWVALLTGSKNALKGAGFFLGGVLLAALGFRAALWAMAGALVVPVVLALLFLPREMGRAKVKTKLAHLLSKSREINLLSAARFFLFGARDVWFVVGAPLFLAAALGWGFVEVGGFLAAWVIGYGVVQSIAPGVISRFTGGLAPDGRAARRLAFLLAAVMTLVAAGAGAGQRAELVLVGGLAVFGVVFAINSSVHSYLVLAYSEGDRVALDVGFYYMANAGGRLVGTLLSGVTYQLAGVVGCLWASAAFALAAGLLSVGLPRRTSGLRIADVKVEGSD